MNLTFLGLCLACFGVSLAEGLMMSSLLKSASVNQKLSVNWCSLLILGGCLCRRYFLRNLGYGLWKRRTKNDRRLGNGIESR